MGRIKSKGLILGKTVINRKCYKIEKDRGKIKSMMFKLTKIKKQGWERNPRPFNFIHPRS